MSSEIVSICIFIAGLSISFFIWVISIRRDVDLNKQQLDNHISGFETFEAEMKNDFKELLTSNRKTQELLQGIMIEIRVANNNALHDAEERKELKLKVVELEKIVQDMKSKLSNISEGYDKIKSSPEYKHIKSQ
jgi:hypothetical protein